MKGSRALESMKTNEKARNNAWRVAMSQSAENAGRLELKYTALDVYPRREKNAIFVNLNFDQNPASVYTGVNRARLR